MYLSPENVQLFLKNRETQELKMLDDINTIVYDEDNTQKPVFAIGSHKQRGFTFGGKIVTGELMLPLQLSVSKRNYTNTDQFIQGQHVNQELEIVYNNVLGTVFDLYFQYNNVFQQEIENIQQNQSVVLMNCIKDINFYKRTEMNDQNQGSMYVKYTFIGSTVEKVMVNIYYDNDNSFKLVDTTIRGDEFSTDMI